MTAEGEGDRLSVLVHEVRSPVAALSAISEALGCGGLDVAATCRLVALAAEAARGIERLVSDAALGSVRLEDVDVRRLVTESVAVAELRGAPIRGSIAREVPTLEGDPVRLRQALDNLIANAVAHTPQGAEVEVGVTTSGSLVLISVSDSGEGISAREQARIFEPGVRFAVDRPGSGLGLAVARAIAEAHGGVLSVESAPGEGATFTLAIPRRQPATRASSS